MARKRSSETTAEAPPWRDHVTGTDLGAPMWRDCTVAVAPTMDDTETGTVAVAPPIDEEETPAGPFRNPATWTAVVFDRTIMTSKNKVYKRALYLAGTGTKDMVTHLERNDGSPVPLADYDAMQNDADDTARKVMDFRKILRLSMPGKSRNKDSKRLSLGGPPKRACFGRNGPDHDPDAGLGPFKCPLDDWVLNRYKHFQDLVNVVYEAQGVASIVGPERLDDDASAASASEEQNDTVGLVARDTLEIVWHGAPLQENQRFKIIDFERDRIIVGPYRRTQDFLDSSLINSLSDVYRVRFPEGVEVGVELRKEIKDWSKILVKRNPAWALEDVATALKEEKARPQPHAPPRVPAGSEGFLHPTTGKATPKHVYEVYGNLKQAVFDDNFTQIQMLAHPREHKIHVYAGEEIIGDSSECKCFICGKTVHASTGKMRDVLGLDLSDPYRKSGIKSGTVFEVKPIPENVKTQLMKHMAHDHPHMPFHYLVPWYYLWRENHQVYSSQIHIQVGLSKAFFNCVLPSALFVHTHKTKNDTLLKCHLSEMIGRAKAECSDHSVLKKKAFMVMWQPSFVDTCNVDQKTRKLALTCSVEKIVLHSLLALDLLQVSLQGFDFVQFVNAFKNPKAAWNSVCLLFSRGMFLTDDFPFVPPSMLEQPGYVSNLLDNAESLYKFYIKPEGQNPLELGRI
jgi:hypothetical protein